MAGTATPAKGASAQSQQPVVESPEVVAARAKANETGFARNRAEAIYNAAKKEKGADSPEAKAAKTTLEAAQAEVEKAQAELKTALKLPTKNSSAPTPNSAKAKAPTKAIPEEPAPAERPKAAVIERIYIERPKVYEYLEVLPTKDRAEFQKRLEKILKELKTEPKNMEYYRKQLNRNGEMLRVLEAPRGEMMIRRRNAAYLLMELSAPKLEKR